MERPDHHGKCCPKAAAAPRRNVGQRELPVPTFSEVAVSTESGAPCGDVGSSLADPPGPHVFLIESGTQTLSDDGPTTAEPEPTEPGTSTAETSAQVTIPPAAGNPTGHVRATEPSSTTGIVELISEILAGRHHRPPGRGVVVLCVLCADL